MNVPQAIFYKCNHALFAHYQKHPQKKLIYFESFHGKQYSDNPRAIYEYMQKHAPEFECVWGVKRGYEAPFKAYGVPYVYRFSLKWYKVVAQAEFWVTNIRTKTWIEKSPTTTYIQTWHGTPLKHIGLDIEEAQIGTQTTVEYHQSVKEETAMWDYVVSPSTYTSQIFQHAFHLREKQILQVGYPRNDMLVQDDETKRQCIRQKLGISNDKKIILYAPTWRENQKDEKQQYRFSLPFDIDDFAMQLPEDTVCLLRMHYLVSEALDVGAYEQLIDVSNYEDMKDLLAIADLLITDYSSCFFDFSLRQKPMLFYMPDRSQYEEVLRGIYVDDLEAILPGPIVEEAAQLYEGIQRWSEQGDLPSAISYEAFHSLFCDSENGTAAQAVCEWIVHRED